DLSCPPWRRGGQGHHRDAATCIRSTVGGALFRVGSRIVENPARPRASRAEEEKMRGHIRERSPCRWAIVIDGRDPATGKRKRRWHSFRGTKREAQVQCA